MNHNQPPKPIEDLLALLDSWLPLSPSFRNELSQTLTIQNVHPKQHLSQPGQHISLAWYSVDCILTAQQPLANGLEEAVAIYLPNTIFTDIHSFLQNSPTQQRLTLLEGSQLLAISKQRFQNLRSLPETTLLLEHYLLEQRQQDLWRLNLLAMKDNEKVATFAQRFPINHLPANISASYLRIDPSRFSRLRAQYNKSR